MGPGAPVYFPEGTSLCDDGPDKRGMGTSIKLFKEHFMMSDMYTMILKIDVYSTFNRAALFHNCK